MAKGYWVANLDVLDPQAYEKYRVANAVAFQKYGGRFVVRGGEQQIREGQPHSRTVIIEFSSYQTAQECYDSPEYQQAKALRDGISQGSLVIVEGYEG